LAKDLRCPLHKKYWDATNHTGDSSDEEDCVITTAAVIPGLMAQLNAVTFGLMHHTTPTPSPAPETSLHPSIPTLNG
jgi:hypothetical protein